ncbi:MAG: VWA domain-containing protein [Pirellulales bacterium]|nr:VWA domain-containing protein [Pirellulales bacterium]
MFKPTPSGLSLLFATLSTAACFAAEREVVIRVESTKPTVVVEKTTVAVESGKPPFEGKRPTVDVAILLDTSNSMDGLIGQAKSQLWTIVQQFAKAKKQGQTPILRVALLEYGNTRLPAAEGYIRQVVPLSDDLDKLSEALFGLTTSGGDEYCGQVIGEAVKRLDWSREPGGYKAIFIAGNEPFTQGSVDYKDTCKQAIGKGIIVNTIHCGSHGDGVEGMWQHGAKLAEGEFFNIDQDRAVVHVDCPQDKIIIKLNTELNSTYLWYGKAETRSYYSANQAAQDENAGSLGAPALAGRSVAKAGIAYNNANRDLVDTLAENKEALKQIKEEELPDELRSLPADKREAHVQKMAARRADIQSQINKLAAEREAYIAKERERLANNEKGDTFGDAVVQTIRGQLTKSGFENTEGASVKK